jgi:hypothetical protein
LIIMGHCETVTRNFALVGNDITYVSPKGIERSQWSQIKRVKDLTLS